MSKLRPLPVLAAGLLLCSAVVALSAQSLPAAQSTSNADQDQSVDTLKVNVDVVQLFFNVKDKRG
ncbi:MAG: VWA domain-containing protein, partial [Acidobacteria bacterium]